MLFELPGDTYNLKTGKKSKYPEKYNKNTGFRELLYFSLIILFSFFYTPAYALNLLQSWERAMKNDPVLARAQFEHNAVQEYKEQAFAALLPEITLEAEEKKTDYDVKSSDNQNLAKTNDKYNTTTYTLNLTQSVYHKEEWERYGQAQKEGIQAEIQLLDTTQDRMLQLGERYFEALNAEMSLQYTEAERDAVKKNRLLAQGKQDSGLGRKTDTLDAEARLADVEARLEEARHNVQQTRQSLMEIIGPYNEPLVGLKENIVLQAPQPEKIEDWLQSAYNGNLQAQIQRLQTEISKYELEIQKAGHYPSVDLLGQFTNQDQDGSVYEGASEIETTEVMLQLSVPIYQGGGVNSRVRQATEQFFAEKERQDEIFRTIERDLKVAFDGVHSAIRRVNYLEKGVAAQKQSVKAKQEGFRTGLYQGIILLDANRDLYFYLRNFSRARTDYLINTLRLARQSGSLNIDDLKKLNQLLQK